MDQAVPELRTDWITGRSVIVAENRALRPYEFGGEVATATGTVAGNETLPSCPFCAGNEFRTPPAVYEKRDEHGRWRLRVVPNMYPAVMPPDVAADVRSVVAPTANRIASGGPAIGAHEVIIESGRHVTRMSALSKTEVRDVLEAYAARLRHWREGGKSRYGLIFKNQGPRAGASIAHLHSQLIALPFVPPAVEAEQLRAAEKYSEQNSCPYCQLIGDERSGGERIVFERDGFIAFCPFASWQPHEVWLMPTDHEASFESAASDELDRLASVLHALIGRVEQVVRDTDYNLLVRTAPWVSGRDEWSHWRIELLPRVNSFAGLEVGAGVHINPLAPERAARQLRPA